MNGRYKARLVLLQSSHTPLRTPDVVGTCDDIPEPGKCFVMWGAPLDTTKDVRTVVTSGVQTVSYAGDGCFLFKTRNSSYELWLLA